MKLNKNDAEKAEKKRKYEEEQRQKLNETGVGYDTQYAKPQSSRNTISAAKQAQLDNLVLAEPELYPQTGAEPVREHVGPNIDYNWNAMGIVDAQGNSHPLESKVTPTQKPKTTTEMNAGANTTTDTVLAQSGFQPSQAVKDAEAYLDSLRSQLEGGNTRYTETLNSLIDEYRNRGDFKYDPNADMLYQNYLSAMQNAGQLAMKDTMGQAAALTGGYGSTYATAAANGAYNNYMQKANDSLADYYKLALEDYNREGNEMLQNINLVADQDANEYSRLMNEYEMAMNKANTLYEREYNDYANALNQAYKYDTLEEEKRQFNENMAYKNDVLTQEAYEKALASIPAQNDMTAKNENDVMADALELYLNSGNMTDVDRYLAGLTGYNLSDDFIQTVKNYVQDNTTKLVKTKNNTFKDPSDGSIYTLKDLKKMTGADGEAAFTEEQLTALKELKVGQNFVF